MRERLKQAGLVCAAVVLACSAARSQGEVVPGPPAEGFGASSKGGAGGRVIWVTNLNADGPGSLREAVDTEGPRIVKFKVAGTIELKRKSIVIGGPYWKTWAPVRKEARFAGPNPYSFVTIDGRSAPGQGITISGCIFVRYGASHVILRHLRIRDNGFVRQNFGTGVTVGEGCRHILVDHCSLSWGATKMVTFYGACSDITFQWCVIADANKSLFIARGADRISVHHNLMASGGDRNPAVGGGLNPRTRRPHVREGIECVPHPIVDCRNNVIYNWHNVSATKTGSGVRLNVIGHYYRPGPSSAADKLCIYIGGLATGYLKGNIGLRRTTDEGNEWADAGHLGPRPQYEPISGPWEEAFKADVPFPAAPVTTHSAETARDLVVAQAGAWPRDPIDAGTVRTFLHGTGRASPRMVQNFRPEDFTNSRPEAALSAEGSSRTVTFKGRATDEDGRIVLCSWYFGDGTYGVGPEVTHTYKEPGRYTAMIFAMDDVGMTGTAAAEVTIRDGQPVTAQVVESLAPEAEWRFEKIADEPAVTVAVPRLRRPVAEGRYPPPEAWKRAARLAPFVVFNDWQEAPDDEVDARIMHDRRRLYLRIRSRNPWPHSIKPARKGPLEYWLRGGVEVYLSPEWGRRPWHLFAVNYTGVMYDALGFDCDWSPVAGWEARSGTEDNVWILEVAVPLESFGVDPSKPGTACGLKLCRSGRQRPGPDGAWVRMQNVFWPSLAPEPEHEHSVTFSPDPSTYAEIVFE